MTTITKKKPPRMRAESATRTPLLGRMSLSGKFLSSQQRVVFLAYALGLAGLWLLSHPYQGIRHDGVLYAGQALLTQNPDVLRADLFFRFGSQDEFTIFSPIYGWLASLLGVGTASLLLVIFGQLLWVTGIAHLLSRMLSDNAERAAALLIVATGVAVYSGMNVLLYGEGFATPRLFAEALVLHGLAWTVGRSRLAAMAAGLIAALFHPLMALPGFVAGALYLAFQDRRFWAIPAAAAMLFILLCILGAPPFDRLLHAMDERWLALVEKRSAFAFLASWRATDWGWFLLHLAGAAGVVLTTTGALRRFFLAISITAVGGLAVSFIGGELLKSVLIIQLQIWRAGWLLAVAGNAAIGILLYRLWRQRTNAVALTALLCTGAFWSNFFPGQLIAATALLVAAAQIGRRLPEFHRLTRWTCIVMGGVSAVFLVGVRAWQLQSELVRYAQGLDAPGYIVFDFVFLTIVCAAVAGSPWARKGWRPLGLAATILLAGMLLWDRRIDEQRLLEASAGRANPFARHLGPTDQVYWRRGLTRTWFLLERPSYVTARQGAGIAFSRETAMEYARRSRIVGALDGREFLEIWPANDAKKKESLALTRPEFEDLAQVCKEPGGPDAVVIEFPYANHWAEKWQLPIVVDRDADEAAPPPDAYYLYLCKQITAGS